jgi:hypothetical protein
VSTAQPTRKDNGPFNKMAMITSDARHERKLFASPVQEFSEDNGSDLIVPNKREFMVTYLQ